ncbi:hypothetical protein [uncultured Algimonas sp.]|uniref:ABC transporter permease/M1 family aminopeptidase n=1 Tax=uncultured Algimonas sp. TaxID=1547920 RepID=UPI00263610BB|nr:hypothetical protein [uncultured Algimonas sp.]
MLRNLLAFEAKLQFRQIGFWVTIGILVLIGVLAGSSDSLTIGVEGGERIKTNSPWVIATFVSTMSVLTIFFAAVFVVTGMMRDDLHKSLEIIHATPVSTASMISSRMLIVWLTTVLCAVAAVVGYALGQFMPWVDAEKYQAFNLLHYLQPTFLFIVVNALLVTGFYTLVAMATRNRAIVYVSAVGLFIVSITISAILTTQAPDWARALLEPFGGDGFLVETEFWPAAEKNTRLVPVDNWFGVNRLLATIIGLGLFALSFVLSKRGIVDRGTKRRNDVPAGIPPMRVDPVSPRLGFGHMMASIGRRSWFEFTATMKSVAIIILVSLAVVIFGINMVFGDMFNPSPTLQTSSTVVNLALGSFTLSIIIVMVFFGSDIVWRDRTAGMHGIIDATPVKSTALLIAKWSALALLLLSLIAIGLVMAFATQLFFGETGVVPRTYLALGIMNFFIVFFFQGMLVMFVQNFMPGRVIGMLVSAGVLIGLAVGLPQLPFYHPLMGFGSASPGQFSEMSGFSNMKSFVWEFGYWFSLIVLLAVLSIWLWRRGLQAGLLHRLRSMGSRLTPVTGAVAALSLAAFIGLGFLGYQDYVARDYMNSDQREAHLAEFERLVGDSYDRDLPRITTVSVDADFDPGARTAEFEGRYTIDNPYDRAIERVHVSSGRELEDVLLLEIEGATPIEGDDLVDTLRAEYDVTEFRFDPPLAPGESRDVRFRTRYTAPTITSGSAIAANGTFVDNASALIRFGGLENAFLNNPDTRRKYDLGERLEWPERDDEAARRYHLLTSFSGYSDYVDFDARICTDPSQIPVAPGKLVREYEEDGKRCREYRAINPIHNFFSFLTADYAKAEDMWDNPDPSGADVALEIYYHPEHDYNVDLMMEAMQTSFDVYTEKFSPYQYAQLRIMEFPYRAFAQAFAGTVPFSENIGFVQDPGSRDDPKTVDFASYITMHEIGHMWFAHQVVGAYAKGSNLLSEGLTEYATMLAYEEAFGFPAARRMHEVRATQRYLMDRTTDRDDEPVLAEAEGQSYLDYNKASWVFWGMRGIMGDDAVLRAVRRFLLEHHSSQGAPYPTTLELIEKFREEIDPRYHGLIEDYWNAITFWELSFDGDPVVTPLSDGRYEIALPIELDKKYASEEDGAETSVSEIDDASLDEWIVVGVYGEDPKDDLGAQPMHQETVRLDKAQHTVTITVDERPSHVVLDPHRYLIERNIGDNVTALDVPGADQTES